MTVGSALARAAEHLTERGVPDARVDAELLLGHVLGLSRSGLVLERERELSAAEASSFDALIGRRARRQPLAYVLREWGFRRLTLSTDARALVPRPETEVVVERCLALVAGVTEPDVLDVGTGTGAIALALADEHPGARVTAIDSSPAALSLARENARRTGLPVRFLRHDLTNGLPGGRYDLVVANPPYVPERELAGLAPDVRDWEPHAALLDRGQTEAIVRAARQVLRAGGWLVLETHWHGAARVAQAVRANGYGAPRISRDLSGRGRVVEAQWER